MTQQKTFSFHCEESDLDKFDKEVNRWLSQNPDIEIQHVAQKVVQTTGTEPGSLLKQRPPNLHRYIDVIMTIFYKNRQAAN